jgi:hypothetical protein
VTEIESASGRELMPRFHGASKKGREVPMRYVEQLFRVAPDGGNGALEVFLLIMLILVVLCMVKLRTASEHGC